MDFYLDRVDCVRLPYHEEVFGDNRHKIFSHYSGKCEVTDFALLLGCYISNTQLKTSDSLKRRTGSWFTCSSDNDGDVVCVGERGQYGREYAGMRNKGIRPVLSIPDGLKRYFNNTKEVDNGIYEVEFGEYPQYAVSTDLNEILEGKYNKKELQKTGKTYTTDSRNYKNFINKFRPVEYIEYEFEGEKYIRMPVKTYDTLSNVSTVKPGNHVWIKVSPIEWYFDANNGLLFSKRLLASGVRFCNSGEYIKSDLFAETEIHMFLNNFFKKDIIPSKFEKEKDQSEFNIDILIQEIYESLEGNLNKEKFIKKLEDATAIYNGKLDKLAREKESGIFSVESYESITNNFELKLNMLLSDIRQYNEKYKESFEMLAILDRYISLMHTKNGDIKDDLTGDLTTIMNICLPFLEEKDAKNIMIKIIDVFENERKEVLNYINDTNDLLYKTVDEMNLDLRRKIHPILVGLSSSVNKRDVEVEIRGSVSKIINGLFDTPKNEVLSFFLVEINNVYTNINALIDKLPSNMREDYKKEILDIMEMNIDYSQEFSDVAENLKTMWLALNKMLFRINDYLGDMSKIKDGHVNLNRFR